MKKNNKQTEATARERFQANYNELEQQVELLKQKMINAKIEFYNKGGKNWGRVGDVAYLLETIQKLNNSK